MKIRLIACVLVILATLGCSSLKVNQDWDRSANFSQYKTYAWQDSGETVRDVSPLIHERVVAAIDQQMSAKGFQKTESNPDVYVTYMSDDDEQLRIDTKHFGYRMGSAWYWGGGRGTSTSTVRSYTKGTLVLDMWDARAKQLIWRATASDIVSENPEKNTTKVNKAVARMFAKFPPPT